MDGKGKSVLHHAANAGSTDIIEFLLNKGAGKALLFTFVVKLINFVLFADW